MTSYTLAPYPFDHKRLTIGIAEDVEVNVIPPFALTPPTWSVSPNGLDFTTSPSGWTLTFRAMRNPGNITISATMPNGDNLSLTFQVIVPTDISFGGIEGNAGIYPLTPGSKAIGDGRLFSATLLPTTVSFLNASFREVVAPLVNYIWPNTTVMNFPGYTVPVPAPLPGNALADQLFTPLFNIILLNNPVLGMQSAVIERVITLQYHNDNLGWVPLDNIYDHHFFMFDVTGACSIEASGGGGAWTSDPRGPWEVPSSSSSSSH